MIVGVLGSSGFLGTNLLHRLQRDGIGYVPGCRSLSVDATKYEDVKRWIYSNGITHIVNLAAVCGGIGLNKDHPYRLWSATTRITATVLDACLAEPMIEKVVMVGTVCSYAAFCPVPFKEGDLMHHGMPEATNRAYGVSKLNGLIGAQAAAHEFNIDITNLIPVNMYGPHDHFNLEDSHVIPALITKVDAAIDTGQDEIEVWGDGSVSREFLYVDDCVEAIMKSLIVCTGSDFINVGTGVETSITNLVSDIAEIMGFKGHFLWNKGQPNGQERRCLDVSRCEKVFGWKPSVTLKDGLAKTIEWYRSTRGT